jgi:heme/copper-type cytochrome/quinol oxidase subunit 4
MTALWRLAITRAWGLLVLATVVVFALAENQAAAPLATIAIMLIAAFKLRLVFLYFMELTGDAMPWRMFAEVWMLVVTGVILGIYLLTPQ